MPPTPLETNGSGTDEPSNNSGASFSQADLSLSTEAGSAQVTTPGTQDLTQQASANMEPLSADPGTGGPGLPGPGRRASGGLTVPRQRAVANASVGLAGLHVNRRTGLRSSGPMILRPAGVVKQSRDRFIPVRRSASSPMNVYLTSKPLYKLNDEEKLLRQRSASPDPFEPASQNAARRTNMDVPTRPAQRQASGLRPGTTRGTVVAGSMSSRGRRRREPSVGSVWRVGGSAAATEGPVLAVPDGQGGLLSSGSTARLHVSRFLEGVTTDQESEMHVERVALACDIDLTNRVLDFGSPRRGSNLIGGPAENSPFLGRQARDVRDSWTIWHNNQWIKGGIQTVLDAPQLRDDFYCSLLAYSATSHTLAVGLSNAVFLWSEGHGVHPMTPSHGSTSHLTSLSFSSAAGGHDILAIGRADGTVSLWCPYDPDPRFEAFHTVPVACVSWRPRPTERVMSRGPGGTRLTTTEDLLVGDDSGDIFYYSVEWPRGDGMSSRRGGRGGAMLLLGRYSVHSQQICGLAWSPDGELFATGGNDNSCCLFEAKAMSRVQTNGRQEYILSTTVIDESAGGTAFDIQHVYPNARSTAPMGAARMRHRWLHGAAVKAMAFCPWQKGLIATGGGSNDRMIHFHHTVSGARLNTIYTAAQVTSLLWSNSRREIAATLGFAQPEHPIRIVVYSWPECQQLVAIPWATELRALYAIPYPGNPDKLRDASGHGEGGFAAAAAARAPTDGCIVVAASDESIKFHEVWSDTRRGIGPNRGVFGGSDILESLAGIDKPSAETIR